MKYNVSIKMTDPIVNIVNIARKVYRNRPRMTNTAPVKAEQPMDDVHVWDQDTPRSEVLLGVYGTEDWILADMLRRRHLSLLTTVQLDVTWIVPAKFSLGEWALQHATQYTFFSAGHCIVQDDQGMLRINASRGKIEVKHIGDPGWVKGWIARFDAQFRRAENLIEWVYSERGESIKVPLNYRPIVKSAYPWFKKDPLAYIDDYLSSDASVLICIGPPGSGKTTLLKNIIHRSGGDAKVAYDERVMMGDSLFAEYIDDDSKFLIMEDADVFLQSRTDGNSMMHRFLNVSDGLISAADKKLVFSTNLPNVNDIDAALMRPGRCFDVIEFRPLTRTEAQAVIAEAGAGALPDGNSITLAEIFSTQPSENGRRKKGIGFTR